MMKKISSLQKKIITVSLIYLAVLLIIFLFLYLPGKKQASKIKAQFRELEKEIKEIETIIGETIDPGKSLYAFREQLVKLSNKLPEKEEEALRQLSGFAQNFNIELISIRPQPKQPALDQNKQPLTIEGRTVQTVFVFLRMKCEYADLVRYIEAVKDDLATFVTFENLNIDKDTSGTGRLDVNLRLSLYLLS